jgi:hypothetical protein
MHLPSGRDQPANWAYARPATVPNSTRAGKTSNYSATCRGLAGARATSFPLRDWRPGMGTWRRAPRMSASATRPPVISAYWRVINETARRNGPWAPNRPGRS